MTESNLQQQQQQVEKEVSKNTQQEDHLSSYTNSSPSNSISLIKLDELSSFGATKQSRLPALIKLNSIENNPMSQVQANSMPVFDGEQMEQSRAIEKHQSSLPSKVRIAGEPTPGNKENLMEGGAVAMDEEDIEGFQVVDMVPTDTMGPSLLPPESLSGDKRQDSTKEVSGGVTTSTTTTTTLAENPTTSTAAIQNESINTLAHRQVLGSSQQLTNQYPSHLGDSLIEMVINLRNENQNLVRALESNNDYVKQRLEEFKRSQEEAKKREVQFAMEKADHEHQERKLQRQNKVLSERLKSMESKLKDMKLEVSESLNAAHSSKNSSLRDEQQATTSGSNLYPQLGEAESFSNSAINQATTMQMDAASGELLNEGDVSSDTSSSDDDDNEPELAGNNRASAPQMETEMMADAQRVSTMTKEELSKRFDANKTQFYAMDDPMKQCDELEKQLNDIGKRDYEICLLQQQLNIYRQDFRLERMAKLEAKIQIEKLKNDIDRLCLDRIEEQRALGGNQDEREHRHGRHSRHRSSIGGVRFDPAVAAAGAVVGKLGHHLSKKAAKSAAKAAKYAAKQAHREEKIAAYAAASAAAASSVAPSTSGYQQQAGQVPQNPDYHGHHHYGHHRRHSHHNKPRGPSIRSEVVNDLLSTANKAMLTGYKMASTHVNLALDKLSAFEQAQANNLASNKPSSSQQEGSGANQNRQQPSAPMQAPSID